MVSPANPTASPSSAADLPEEMSWGQEEARRGDVLTFRRASATIPPHRHPREDLRGTTATTSRLNSPNWRRVYGRSPSRCAGNTSTTRTPTSSPRRGASGVRTRATTHPSTSSRSTSMGSNWDARSRIGSAALPGYLELERSTARCRPWLTATTHSSPDGRPATARSMTGPARERTCRRVDDNRGAEQEEEESTSPRPARRRFAGRDHRHGRRRHFRTRPQLPRGWATSGSESGAGEGIGEGTSEGTKRGHQRD